jgi:hypothetical protein
VPVTPDKTLLFVQVNLLARLSEAGGPRLAMALLDGLVERLEAPPESGVVPVPPPSSAYRVAHHTVRSRGQPARGTFLVVDNVVLRSLAFSCRFDGTSGQPRRTKS